MRPVVGCLLTYIIIIIIWHYSPLWGFIFSAKSLQLLLSLAVSFQSFYSNIQPAILDRDFIPPPPRIGLLALCPTAHPGGPGFVLRVFSPRWVSFSMLIEALLPMVFFQGFPSLSLWGFSPSPATAAVAVLLYWWHLLTRSQDRPRDYPSHMHSL
jgi:hypothetical protein